MTDLPKYTLVYLGTLDRFDRDQQLDLCHQVVDALDLPPIVDKIYEHNEIDDFIGAMRGSEVAVVPLLQVLAGRSGPGVGTRFYINERKLHDGCQFIVSLDTTKRKAIADLITVRSDAGRDWYELLARTGNSVMKGQKLTTNDARAKARMPRAKPGLVATWKLKEGTAEYKAIESAWSNMGITPAEKAISMFPDDELSKASRSTVERIFGTRSDCLKRLN